MLVTGAGGQLGRALAEEFADDGIVAVTRALWDVTLPPPPQLDPGDLVLHAAAWTDVDGAEDDPQGAAAVNVGGTANVAALGAPLVYYSTDYVFDGRKRRALSRVRRPEPAVGIRALEAARRGGGRRAGLDRALVLALRADRAQLRPDDAAGRERSATRCRSSTTSAARRPTSAILRRPRGRSSSCRTASTTSPPSGDATWADFAEAIFEEAGLDTRVRRITTAELDPPRKAPRPAYSVLRSEKGAPELPHWREGLRECMAAIRTAGESE